MRAHNRRKRNLGITMALALAASSLGARADVTAQPGVPEVPSVISSDIDPTTNYYTVINTNIGAQRFYDAGYFGFNATLANVEAGYVWNGHETLGNVTSFISNSPANATANQYDYHATAVGFVMVGQGPAPYYYYQMGVAPEAGLASVAIATDWVGATGGFDVSASTFVYGYKTVMSAPVTTTHQTLSGLSWTMDSRVDVVNSSWGYYDPARESQMAQIIDSLAYANHQTVCIAAGNHTLLDGATPVSGPATAFNVIAVGALGDDISTPKYNDLAAFSNTGPNDFYNPSTGILTHGVRAAVSIAAPGTNLILAAYTGATGTNQSGTLFDTSGFPDDQLNKLYFHGAQGTSFASPTVAGGAGLLADAGHVNFGGGVAVDGRVIKAVLLNSARKTPGWTNNTVNINGVLTTTQGLDWNVGAGALDLNAAYDQYLSGTTNNVAITGGTVQKLGWAFGHVTAGTPNDYFFDTPLHAGDKLTATLTWFIPEFFKSTAVPNINDGFAPSDLHEWYFDQLGLQVWNVVDGQLTTLIADSHSPYNNVDHLYFDIPGDGMYALRVSFLDVTYDLFETSPWEDDYALAWSGLVVPEPVTGSVVLVGMVVMLVRRNRRQ